jgi:hypothetical protein
MQGDVVKAAKWLGGCMVAASLVLVVGFHPTVTGRVVSFTRVQPEPLVPPAGSYYPAVAPAPVTGLPTSSY